MKSHAQVVIIGGGSLGVNLAYHLSKEGWNDVALVEKGELTSGSTWHAAGLCPHFNGNHTISKIHQYTTQLYNEILPAESGLPSSFHKTGSLRVGYTEVEEHWFNNIISRSRNIGCEMHMVSLEEAKALSPVTSFSSKPRCILYTPDDGHVDPSSVVMPLAQLAKANGVELNRFTRVEAINIQPSGGYEVITDKGNIFAEHVVNAGGCFAPEVGRMVGVHVPIINLEHQYLVTEDHPDLAALSAELPVMRDSWCNSYIRQEGKALLIGPYETSGAKPWALDGMDWSFDRELFEGDLTRLMPFLERCMELVPIFQEVGIKTIVNGPITHTPDDNFLVGPAKGLRNFWNLCGASIGIAQGGIGKYLAQWMVYGQTELNMASLDSRRFDTWADKTYCITRAIEAYENMYACGAPNLNRPHARPQRCSPLYTTLIQKGAVHHAVGGYEKPAWIKCGPPGADPLSWTHNNSHKTVAEECHAVMEHCGVIDFSGTAKFRVTGADATAFLDALSCNALPQKDGRISLTLLHAPLGGIMAELSISRISAQEYILMGAIACEVKDLQWLQWHQSGFDVEIENITDSWSGVLLTGPKSRELLSQLTQDDLSNAAFPWLSCKTIQIDSADVFAMRVSYAGELGWELHMPAWQLLSIYESLHRVGADLGLRDFGALALNSMRMEKMYPAYGAEFTEEVSAIEAAMNRFTDSSREFLGVEKIRQHQQKGVTRQLAYLVFDDDIPAEIFGNEAVYVDNKVAGLTTGGAYGHRIGKSLAFAYLPPEYCNEGQMLTVESSLGMRQAHIELKASYDSSNKRVRA